MCGRCLTRFIPRSCRGGGGRGRLTGFAFSIVALSFWVWTLPPQTAALLAVF